GGGLIKRTFTENNAIESRIDNVSAGACKYQGDIEDKAPVVFILYHIVQTIPNTDDGYNTEKGEKELAELPAKLHTVGHAIVLNEVDEKLIADDVKVLTDGHIEFYPKLRNLIYEQDNCNQ